MERHLNSTIYTSQAINRRTFLAVAVGGIAYIANGCRMPDRAVEPLDRIKEFESRKKDYPLSRSDAQEYADILVAFFANEVNGFDSKEVRGKIFLVNNFETISPKEFKKNYPQIYPISEEMLKAMKTRRNVPAFISGGNIFVNLKALNNPATNDGKPLAQLAFDKTELADLSCDFSTPAERFRHALVHELFHYYAGDYIALGNELTHANNPILQGLITEAMRSGFAVNYYLRNNLIAKFFKFNEFVTDYLTVQLFLKNGLKIVADAYYSPHEIENFKKMLNQSGISFEELQEYYRGSKIKDFLYKMAQGEEGVVAALTGLTILSEELRWQNLKQFYPDIEDGSLVYAPGSFIHINGQPLKCTILNNTADVAIDSGQNNPAEININQR